MTELQILSNPSVVARFKSKVKVNKETGCHEWQAGKSDGYGTFWVTGYRCGNILAHRYAYTIAHQESIPDELLIRHKCDNNCCCNPEHLELGTALDNARDKAKRGRNANSVLTPSDVVKVYELSEQGYTNVALAKMFNMSDAGMRRVRLGRTWPELYKAYHEAKEKARR